MSNKLRFSFEELVETPIDAETVTGSVIDPEIEHQRLALEIDEINLEINRKSELVEGLECLSLIASKLDKPTSLQVALFRTAANFAVAGTDQSAQSFLPAMESNQPIAMEGFIEKTREIIRNIIAKLKEFWDKIVDFFKSIFSKEKKVEEFDDKLNKDVKAKEEEIKKDDIEVVIVKTPEPFDVYESSKDILKEHTDIKPVKSAADNNSKTSEILKDQINLHKKLNEELKKILIPEKVEIYNKDSKIFPKSKKCHIWVYMDKGAFTHELDRFLKSHIDRVNISIKEIKSGFSALEVNIMDLNENLSYYIKEEDKKRSRYSDQIDDALARVERNYSDMINKFIKSYGDPDLLNPQMYGPSNTSYHSEIIGGYGFQTILDGKKVLEINFNNNFNPKDAVKETCILELNEKDIRSTIGNREENIKYLISSSKSFNSFVVNKMDLNEKILVTLNEALKHLDLDQDGINAINKIKSILFNIDKFILTINKHNNFILDVMYEADVISYRVLKLYNVS